MWNSRKYAAMAIAGVGLAVAAATPASAWWPGYGGYYGAAYGGCGAYGYAPSYGYAGYGGCGSYGYAGASYGLPYATYGYAGYPAYGYGGCGGYYGAASYGGCGGYGYAPTYGYAPSYYGYSAGYGCGARHPRSAGYAVANHRPYGDAYAAYRPRNDRPSADVAYNARPSQRATAFSPRYSANSATQRQFVVTKQGQNKFAHRAQSLKLAGAN